MLILTGKGGEGKSRIGLVLHALLGSNMNTGSIAKVETSPFARADLEHELLMVDDDMKLEALPQTNNIKAIVTAELPMDLEKKGKQSYQGDLYVRFLALGNGTLQSLYDRSVGFFRRQIILSVKEKDSNRKDDPYIAEKMCAEAEGIFLWALEGLQRLIANDYRFTVSQAAQENMEAAVSDGNNVIEFLQSEGYIRFKADYEVSSKDLYAVYKMWCEDNAVGSLSAKSFCSYLKQNADTYKLEYTNKIRIGGSRMARGFWGIELLQRPT
jgi:putative DNA primase/helicase